MLDEPVTEDDDPVVPPTVVDPNGPKVLIVGSGLECICCGCQGDDAEAPELAVGQDMDQDHGGQAAGSFLPLVADKGQVMPHYQRSLHKTLAILKQQIMQREFGSKVSIRAV
ncbi:hypothetical protein BG000_001616 [Podila horticola]|nr:hypothetical protein BG000_001616 [Podila horticola]